MRSSIALFSLFAIVSCYQPTPGIGIDPVSETKACVPAQLGSLAPLSVQWTASKNGDALVEGTISGEGLLTLGAGSSLNNAYVSISFDSKSVDSKNEIRDGRLQGVFLNADVFESAVFEGRITPQSGELSTIPAAGQSRRIRIIGDLVMAGESQSLNLAAKVVAEPGRIFVTHDDSRTALIDIKATDVLNEHVAELISLANLKSIEPSVAIKSEFNVVNNCP